MLPRLVSVTSNEPIAEGIHRLWMDIKIDFQPGQFVMVWIPGIDEKPFAIVDGDPLSIVVASVGPTSSRLARAVPGDVVGVRGPFGRGFRLTGREPLLVGGGYGTAALLPLARLARVHGLPVHVALGAKTAGKLILAEDFASLGSGVVVATNDGSLGYKGHVTEIAANILRTEQVDFLYACGPEPMLVQLAVMAHGRVPAQLSVERYIKCAIGVCGQCTLGGKLVCVDGPVFTGEELWVNPEFGRFHRAASGARIPLVPEMATACE